MLNIFLELWKAQQENQVSIQELYFPDTFILDESHNFIWLFRSKQESKILRKKKLNSTIDNIVKSLTGQNLNQSIYETSIDSKRFSNFEQIVPQSLGQIAQLPETPYATFSRLNDQGEIEIQHLNIEQIKKFFSEVEYKSALPRDSIFLQKYMRVDQNEIHNHFIKVVYNTNFIQIDKRRNCYFWQNLTENSNKPKDHEYYNCLVSYEGPDQFTEVEKVNEYTANQLKYLVKQICIQLESVHSKERGRVRQISLIFKKINDLIYLLHCNEISFEREQHIPKLWRMSFNHNFTVPMHIKCAPKPLSVQFPITNSIQSQHINKKNNESRLTLAQTLHKQPKQSQKTFDESKNKNLSFEQQKFSMCFACGQPTQQLQEVMKNKLLRIRIKRGVRENFNGLRPLYDSHQKQEKALFDKYTSVKVCAHCFICYQEIQKDDEQQSMLPDQQTKEAYGYQVQQDDSQKIINKFNRKNSGRLCAVGQKNRSKSFNIVSFDEIHNSEINYSIVNDQSFIPIEYSSLNSKKINQFNNLFNKNSNKNISKCNASYNYGSNNNIDTYLHDIDTSFYQRYGGYQNQKQSQTLNVDQLDEIQYDNNNKNQSFEKEQQVNSTQIMLNKHQQYKFKELRSKSTQRSQKSTRILPQLQDQLQEDSFINEMSSLQKSNINNINSITPMTEDQNEISEALSLLQEYKGNDLSKNCNNLSIVSKKSNRTLSRITGRQRTHSIGITPTVKSQYQMVIQSVNVTPHEKSNLNNPLNNKNKSTKNVITSSFNQYENNKENIQLSNNEIFLKKFYQQQMVDNEKQEVEQLVEIIPNSSKTKSRDYISINHTDNNQCLRSEDILNKMRDINSGKETNKQDSHEKIISDYDKIYQDQKYQIQLLKQKNNFISEVIEADIEQKVTPGVPRSRNSSSTSKSTNNSTTTVRQSIRRSLERNNNEYNESILLQNIRNLEKQLQDSNNEDELVFDNLKENQNNLLNQNNNNNNQANVKQSCSNQKFQLPPKPVYNRIKTPLAQNLGSEVNKCNQSQKYSQQFPLSTNSLSPYSFDSQQSSSSSISRNKSQENNSLYDKSMHQKRINNNN